MAVSYLSLIIVMFFAMMSPGPDFVLLVKNGTCYPRRQAILSALGIVTGLVFHIGLSVLGLAIIISSTPLLYQLIRIMGAAYLAYIGFQAVRAQSGSLALGNDTRIQVSDFQAYREGLITNLLNVKATLFFFSVFTQLVPPEVALTERISYGVLLLIESLVVWILFVLLIQSRPVQRRIQRYRIWFSRIFGILLILLAIRIFFS